MLNKMKKEKGFTLIELLATIVILAIVSGLVVYVAINTINNSKENSYKVTINNIEHKVGNYLIENSDRLFYVSNNDNTNKEYQCITVQALVDSGYFDNNVVESKVDKDRNVSLDDYVYIARDVNTKTVVEIKYLLDSDDMALCDVAIDAEGDVLISVTPDDYSLYKEITLNIV